LLGGLSVEDEVQGITELDDRGAIDSVSYLINWIKICLKERSLQVSDVEWDSINEQLALEILTEAFPDASMSLSKMISTENLEGQLARKFLLYLYQREQYMSKVKEALHRPILKGEPLTVAVITCILFFLTLEFDFEYEEINGQERKKIRISRKAISAEALDSLKKIINF
jgi:hypothetical protein